LDIGLASNEDRAFIIYASVQKGITFAIANVTATVYDPSNSSSTASLLDNGVCKYSV